MAPSGTLLLISLVFRLLQWKTKPPHLSAPKWINCWNNHKMRSSASHLAYFLFHDTTFHLVLALSASLCPKYGTPYLFTSANPKHTLPSDVVLRRRPTTLLSFRLSCPCNAPWFFSETLVLYKSLTYLLTDIINPDWMVSKHTDKHIKTTTYNRYWQLLTTDLTVVGEQSRQQDVLTAGDERHRDNTYHEWQHPAARH